MHEEMEPGGQLYTVRWMRSSLLQSVHLLGMSVLCYCVQLAKRRARRKGAETETMTMTTTAAPPRDPDPDTDVLLDPDTNTRILRLLRDSYPLWLRASAVSRDTRAAVQQLNLILGMRGGQQEAESMASYRPGVPIDGPCDSGFAATPASSFDQMNWVSYQGIGSAPQYPEDV
jgi:hypothetical protein